MTRLLLAVAAGTGIASLVGLLLDPSALHLALFLLAAPAAWLLAVAEWRARRRAAGTAPARPSTPVVAIVGVAVAGLVLTPALLPADDDASAARPHPSSRPATAGPPSPATPAPEPTDDWLADASRSILFQPPLLTADGERATPLHEPGAAEAAIDAITAEAGSTVSHVWVLPDGVQATVQVSADGDTADYAFRDGAVYATGQTATVMTSDDLFDTRDVDWSQIARIAAEAPRLAGLAEPAYPTISVERSIFEHDVSAPQIRVRLTEPYETTLTYAADGSLLEMRGGAPGSAAEKATPADTGNAG
jgi:hypothetical protein